MLRINGASGWLVKNSVRKFIPFDLHVLGAPPAFVLSQDQTLYKWYLSLKSVKSLFAQHAIACVLCELLCLELFNVFFQHENRFRYKFFDIVQFSRSCKRLSQVADSLFILSQKWFFVKLFFRSFSFLIELGAFSVSRRWPELSDVYWFFSLYFQPGLRSHSFVSALGAQV